MTRPYDIADKLAGVPKPGSSLERDMTAEEIEAKKKDASRLRKALRKAFREGTAIELLRGDATGHAECENTKEIHRLKVKGSKQ